MSKNSVICIENLTAAKQDVDHPSEIFLVKTVQSSPIKTATPQTPPVNKKLLTPSASMSASKVSSSKINLTPTAAKTPEAKNTTEKRSKTLITIH